jgi:electron transfer flavoprotein alpha subunit
MNEVLLLVEAKDGSLDKKTLELIRGASDLAKDLGTAASAVVVGHETASLAGSVASYGLNKIYRLDHPLLNGFLPDAWLAALEGLCRQIAPRIFVFSHSFVGKEVAPRLAYRLNTELTTDCIGLKIDSEDGLLIRTKPIYGGNAIAVLKCEGIPQIVTVRKNAFEPMEQVTAQTEIFAMVPSLGCSRPVVDKCWMSSDHQVGLTGSMIAPDTYIAIGISGAIQHLVGMIRSKKIIAINTDAGCNMFKVSDYGVVADYKEILPTLLKKLEE